MLHKRVLGQGPDLVLLHGWGMNSAVWDDLAASLADDYRLHLFDLPGHGRSPWPGDLPDLRAWSQCLLAEAPEEAIWIGWSLGGSLALQAALDAPERVTGLCLVTATPRFTQSPDWPKAMPQATLKGFHRALLEDPPGTLERFLSLQVRGSESARELLRDLRHRLGREPPASDAALASGLDLLRDCDLRDRLDAIEQPSLWLYGERDTLVPAASAEYLSEFMPQARISRIPGSAHAPFLSHRQAALEHLQPFLESLQ
jgi:pimeloyl-[acyl-carrier protein] methyl ester esterase